MQDTALNRVSRETTDETPRYRAFSSYSHADEKAAAWLPRALESYRLP